MTELTQLLVFSAYVEVIYGGLMCRFRPRHGRNHGSNIAGLMFGSVLVIFGQSMLIMTMKQTKMPMFTVLFMKAVLSISALFFAMGIMESSNWKVLCSLMAYAIFGFIHSLVIHKESRKQVDHEKTKLGELSESERAAMGAELGQDEPPIPQTQYDAGYDAGYGMPPPDFGGQPPYGGAYPGTYQNYPPPGPQYGMQM